MKVLLADDDPIARAIAGARLVEWGYEVQAVEDGNAALRALREPLGPRIGLLDWSMPGLDGPEVCRALRADPHTANAFLILLTARDAASDIAEALESGANDFLTKPFDPRELRARLGVAARVVGLEDQLRQRVDELQKSAAAIARLEGLLPICAYCHSVRQGENYWQRLDLYVAEHGVTLSHGICPQCYETHMRPQLEAMEAGTPGGTVR
jgi:DNA-binding response OmpR family regulator